MSKVYKQINFIAGANGASFGGGGGGGGNASRRRKAQRLRSSSTSKAPIIPAPKIPGDHPSMIPAMTITSSSGGSSGASLSISPSVSVDQNGSNTVTVDCGACHGL